MLIGILSDSHGRALRTRTAIQLLIDAGADLLLHLGDFETEAVIDELAGHPARLVFGNCDMHVSAMRSYAEHLGLTVDHPMGTIEIRGKQIAFTHGDRDVLMQSALHEGVDYLLHGHTHQVRDQRVGTTRILNPGALFRASRYTAGLLDPLRDRWTVIDIPRE